MDTTPLDPEREIYPSPILKLVAFELRFPEVPTIEKQAEALTAALRSELPIPGQSPQQVTLEIQKDGPPITQHRSVGARQLNRTRSRSVALTPVSLLAETSIYECYEAFRSFVAFALSALESTIEIPAMARLGLRYIDEIDATKLPGGSDWTRFIASTLLAPLEHFEKQPVEMQTQIAFDVGDQRRLACRYGQTQHAVVKADGPLAIPEPTQGDCFIFDLDSSWSSKKDDSPAFSSESALAIIDELHHPIRSFFESAITEELRDEVLRVKHD